MDNASTGAILNKLMHKSFSVAKRVRTETGIASHAVSISFAAVELARKIFGDLHGRHVLLIGAGEMAELAAEHLLTHGASRITVANRTLERAVNLAQRGTARPHRWTNCRPFWPRPILLSHQRALRKWWSPQP